MLRTMKADWASKIESFLLFRIHTLIRISWKRKKKQGLECARDLNLYHSGKTSKSIQEIPYFLC